ncbi:hypothetical protein P8452_74409 [Trifolium repens]|nr:hypothetical protein P8452_74409 [Trifolium repens]
MKLRLIKAKQSPIFKLNKGKWKVDAQRRQCDFEATGRKTVGRGKQRRLYGQRDEWVICFTEEQLKEIRVKEYETGKLEHKRNGADPDSPILCWNL